MLIRRRRDGGRFNVSVGGDGDGKGPEVSAADLLGTGLAGVPFIDRSYIVNIIQIMKVSEGKAVLKNGAELPISRAHLQEVKLQINRFWGARI